jgi:hypothetical protein
VPSIPFGLSSFERGPGDLPELPCINMYAEEAPTEDKGIVLQSRPNLEDRSADMGGGPVRQLFQRDLVLSSALFGVSGALLYRATAALGAITGSGFVSMAGNEIGLMVAAGGSLHYYNGTVLSAVTFPDGADVIDVFTGGSRFWAIRADTGKIYWTDALQADVEALDFATAESLPDRLLQGLWIDGMAILFGSESVELWATTGSATLPITPLQNRVIERGIKATGCATPVGPTFAWVTNENQVCLTDENTVVSNAGLEEKIEASSECVLFRFFIGGMECLALRTDNETHFMPLRTRMWHEMASYGEDNWIPQCYAAGVFGSSVDGKTLEWGTTHEDLGGVMERRFRAGFRPDAPVTVSNLRLSCNVGQAAELTGDYTDPEVEMRVSLNHGKTWTDWKQKPLGVQGAYDTVVQWLALGMTRLGFGWLVEFRITDPVDWRVSDVRVNDSFGGR